jgi:DnaK suppressor protein
MNIEEIKQKLENEKKEIEILLSYYKEQEKEVLEEPAISSDEHADRYEYKEEMHLKEDVLKNRLMKINKALKKIEDKEYGICEKCGKKIEDTRLEIDPAVEFCRFCAINF